MCSVRSRKALYHSRKLLCCLTLAGLLLWTLLGRSRYKSQITWTWNTKCLFGIRLALFINTFCRVKAQQQTPSPSTTVMEGRREIGQQQQHRPSRSPEASHPQKDPMKLKWGDMVIHVASVMLNSTPTTKQHLALNFFSTLCVCVCVCSHTYTCTLSTSTRASACVEVGEQFAETDSHASM